MRFERNTLLLSRAIQSRFQSPISKQKCFEILASIARWTGFEMRSNYCSNFLVGNEPDKKVPGYISQGLTSVSTPAEGPIAFQGLFGLSPNGKFRPRQFKDILDGASNTLAYGEIAGTPPRTSTRSMNRSGWAFGAKYSSSGKVTEIYGCKTVTKGINEPVGKINDVPFASNHPSGAQFAMADGSTHFIDASIDLDILKILSSMDGRKATTPLF